MALSPPHSLYSQALVLRAQAYKERQFWLDVFSKKSGRMRLLLNSSEKTRAQNKGNFQAFRLLELQWNEPNPHRTHALRLQSFKLIEHYHLPAKHLMDGLYLTELLLRLLPQNMPFPHVFDCYLKAIQVLQLDDDKLDVQLAFFYVELALLKALGIDLSNVLSQTLPPYPSHFWITEQGELLACEHKCTPACLSVSSELLMALNQKQALSQTLRYELRTLLDECWRLRLKGKEIHSERMRTKLLTRMKHDN